MTVAKNTVAENSKKHSGVTPSRDIGRLLAIMAALRTPKTGCPWDLEQNFATIAPYTLEEAYEVADAIARDDLDRSARGIGRSPAPGRVPRPHGGGTGRVRFRRRGRRRSPAKLIRRHPHVFGDEGSQTAAGRRGFVGAHQGGGEGGAAAARRNRRAGRCAGRPPCPHPRAEAAGQGRQGRLRLERSARGAAKIREEADEIEAALDGDASNRGREVGDLLFAVVNLARHLRADPEAVLRETNRKFERRFAAIEQALAADGKTPQDATLAEMDALWDAAKARE